MIEAFFSLSRNACVSKRSLFNEKGGRSFNESAMFSASSFGTRTCIYALSGRPSSMDSVYPLSLHIIRNKYARYPEVSGQ
jgi:hypothetical protein